MHRKDPRDRVLVTLKELAPLRLRSLSSLYKDSMRGKLPGIRRVGSRVFVDLEEYDLAMDSGALSGAARTE